MQLGRGQMHALLHLFTVAIGHTAENEQHWISPKFDCPSNSKSIANENS